MRASLRDTLCVSITIFSITICAQFVNAELNRNQFLSENFANGKLIGCTCISQFFIQNFVLNWCAPLSVAGVHLLCKMLPRSQFKLKSTLKQRKQNKK